MTDLQYNSGSKACKRAEVNLQGKLRNSFLRSISHNVVPGYNLNRSPNMEHWDTENLLKLFQEFPYYCDFPKPLLPPVKLPRSVLNEEDPALQLITVKSRIRDEIDRLTEYHGKNKKAFKTIHKNEVTWTTNGDTTHTTLPRYIADLAEVIEMDRDFHFDGKYNWYYTGGSLNNLQLNGTNILIFPYMKELVSIPIISEEESLWNVKLRNGAKCDLDGILYELRHNVIGNVCRILGRYKDHCIIYSLSEAKEKLQLFELHKQVSSVPYVSADLNPFDLNKYCTMNMKRSLALWDLNRIKFINSGTILETKVLEDNWANVRFQQSDPNVIVFVDRCCLHYIDIRESFETPALTLCPKTNLEACENLSLDFPSRNNLCRYVGTYHSLILCDSRWNKQGVQQKWTHQFKSAPLFADTYNRNEEEIIVLSSQISGEIAIVLNTWTSDDNPHSYSLPYRPPSILETLTTSQRQGLCLDPAMKNRLELCNAGCTLTTNSDRHVSLFLQNSIGDVFYQSITHEELLDKHSSVNTKSYYALDVWERASSMQGTTIKPLLISEKANMQHIYSSLTDKTLHLRHDNDNENLMFREPKWKQSLEKLNSYVDILAPELLAAWEVSEEPVVPLSLSAVPHEKVLNWLEGSTANTKSTVQSKEDEPEYVPTPVSTQELISVSQIQDVICEQDFTQGLYNSPVKTKTNQKKNVKKRKYISGF